MIYFILSDQPQQVYIPRNGFTPGGELTFSLRSTSGLNSVATTVSDWEVAGCFIRFNFAAPAGLIGGEWEFSLSVGSDAPITLATGLLRVLEEKAAGKQYNENIEYKQYGD